MVYFLRRLFIACLAAIAFLAAGVWARSYFSTDGLRSVWSGHSQASSKKTVLIATSRGIVAIEYESVLQLPHVLTRMPWDGVDNTAVGRAWMVLHLNPRTHDAISDYEGHISPWYRPDVDSVSQTIRLSPPWNGTEQDHFLLVTVPIWIICILEGLVPMRAMVSAMRKHRRIRNGCCAVCGYDLRGSMNRCPECGSAPDQVGVKS